MNTKTFIWQLLHNEDDTFVSLGHPADYFANLNLRNLHARSLVSRHEWIDCSNSSECFYAVTDTTFIDEIESCLRYC